MRHWTFSLLALCACATPAQDAPTLQAGFTEVMDTEVMLAPAIREFQRRRLLPGVG